MGKSGDAACRSIFPVTSWNGKLIALRSRLRSSNSCGVCRSNVRRNAGSPITGCISTSVASAALESRRTGCCAPFRRRSMTGRAGFPWIVFRMRSRCAQGMRVGAGAVWTRRGDACVAPPRPHRSRPYASGGSFPKNLPLRGSPTPPARDS